MWSKDQNRNNGIGYNSAKAHTVEEPKQTNMMKKRACHAGTFDMSQDRELETETEMFLLINKHYCPDNAPGMYMCKQIKLENKMQLSWLDLDK